MVPTNESLRPTKGDRTRQALLEAAIVRFAHEGYRGASVANICRMRGSPRRPPTPTSPTRRRSLSPRSTRTSPVLIDAPSRSSSSRGPRARGRGMMQGARRPARRPSVGGSHSAWARARLHHAAAPHPGAPGAAQDGDRVAPRTSRSRGGVRQDVEAAPDGQRHRRDRDLAPHGDRADRRRRRAATSRWRPTWSRCCTWPPATLELSAPPHRTQTTLVASLPYEALWTHNLPSRNPSPRPRPRPRPRRQRRPRRRRRICSGRRQRPERHPIGARRL